MLNQSDLFKIRSILQSELKIALKDRVTKVEVKNEFSKMTKKMNLIISFFDKEHQRLEKRVQKMEHHGS